MPIDWLTVWGVTQAAGFLFKPVLEDLAIDAAKDIAKDKIKDGFGSVWKNDPGALLLLRERAENDPTPWLREKAKRLAERIETRRKNI